MLLLSLLTWGTSVNAQETRSYCESGSTSSSFEYISNVTFGDVNNDSQRENYGDFTALSSLFNVGQTFDVSVTVNGFDNDYVAVWVDWNQDADFSESEKSLLAYSKENKVLQGSIEVPSDVTPGKTRMRVSCSYNVEPEPCASFMFGEVEDYSVEVVAEGLYASFTANVLTPGMGEEVVFTDASFGEGITSYSWDFGKDASPATASGVGPHTVTYSSGGPKTVSLTISDGTDTKTTTKEAYIAVVTGNAGFAVPAFFSGVADHNVIRLSWYSPNETPQFVNPEGFESGVFPPPGWEVKVSDNLSSELVDLESGVVTWNLNNSNTYLHSGSGSAIIGYSSTKSNWLITPEIDIEANKQLSFYMHFKNTSSYTSKFDVMVKEGTAQWTSILSFDANSASNEMATPVIADLASYAGKIVKVAFVQTYTNGYGIAIDDITIEDKTASAKSNAAFRIAADELDVKTSINEIQDGRERTSKVNYYNYDGIKATEDPIGYRVYINGELRTELDADARTFNLENLPKGEYTCAVSAVYAGGESYQTELLKLTTVNPEVNFEASSVSIGMNEDITFNVSVNGSYTDLLWDFGTDATPANASAGEVNVSYSTIGKKTVSVTINGDIVTTKKDYITVKPGSGDVDPLEGVSIVTDYNDVTLNWPSLTATYKMKEGFEEENWPALNWTLKKSTEIDGTLTDVTGDDNSWFHCDASSFDNAGAKYVNNGAYSAAIAYSATGFNWLISPEQDIEDGDKLNFWLWYMNAEANDGVYYYTNFRVMVKADNVWNEALYYTDGADPNEYETQVSVDLSAYAGKKIQFAFVYEFTDGWQLAIDDIEIAGTGSKSLADNFSKLNIYRDDIIVHEITDVNLTKWTDANLETGAYKYYITFVNKEDKESYPSEELYVNAYKTLDMPYSQDFEAATDGWLFNEGDYAFKIGETADFVKENYSIPARDGKFVGVNTSDITGGMSGYTQVSDIIALPPLNLGSYGRVYFELDYVSEMPAFAIVGRQDPNANWKIITQLEESETWKTEKITLPASTLTDGYQLGLFYTNSKVASKGLAFDNIKLSVLSGKHISIEYKDAEIANGAETHLGLIKPETTKDYTLKIINIGDESMDLSTITISGDKFTIKTNPQNSTLAVQESAEIVVTYTPTAETTTPDAGQIIVNSNAEENPFTINIKAECGSSKWTYMLYLYEDNTGLDGNKDINEWEVLGSDPGIINYIVLYDCDDDAKDGIYYVSKDPDGMNSTIISERVSTFLNDGLDMNDAETLEKFMIWCKENYPAEHYGCNVWDHGNGIFKKSKDNWKAACGEMKVWDLAEAVKAFKDVDGQGFDIFGFDVCLLGQVETVYALKDYTKVVVASEKTEPGDGWDYTTQFSLLNENPNVDIYEFAKHIVVEYDNSYAGGSQGTRETTQSATRTDEFNNKFIPALNAFAEAIIPEMYNSKNDVKAARSAAWYSDGSDFIEHKDLGHFLTLLKSKSNISDEVKTKIDELLTAYEASIVESQENSRPNATGLKIWMPENISNNTNSQYYLNADLYLTISETKWDEFLSNYQNPVEPSAIIDENPLDLRVYPNPNNGVFTIKMDKSANANWYLFNIIGKVVDNGLIENNEAEINVSQSGIYLLKVISDGKSNIMRVVVK